MFRFSQNYISAPSRAAIVLRQSGVSKWHGRSTVSAVFYVKTYLCAAVIDTDMLFFQKLTRQYTSATVIYCRNTDLKKCWTRVDEFLNASFIRKLFQQKIPAGVKWMIIFSWRIWKINRARKNLDWIVFRQFLLHNMVWFRRKKWFFSVYLPTLANHFGIFD